LAIVVDPTQFNPAALTVPAVYLIVEPPQASITGAPASVFGKVGTASWGPVNQAQLIGSLQAQNITFGSISAASLTDPFDMATSVWASYQQASSPQGLTIQGVRVTDGTDAAASLVLKDNQGNVQTVTVGGMKTTGDTLSLTFTASGITGSPVAVPYVVLSGDSLATITTAFKNAINANAALAAAGITATSSGMVVTVTSNDLDVIPVITNTSTGTPTETLVIASPSAVTGGTLNALYTGVLGNQIKVSILPGSSSSKVNVLLTAWAGKAQEFYTGLPNTSAFWAALQSTLSGGAGPTTPASNLARLTLPGSGSPMKPQQIIASPLTGGTDGRSGVTSGDLVGSATGGSNGQGSGLYALLPAKPFCQQAACVGLTDMTVAPSIQEFAYQNGILMFIAQAINTDPTDAVTALNTYGIDNYQVVCFIDWCQMYDPINQVARYVSPDGPLGGLVAALAPQNSPLNKQLQGVITTARLQAIGPYNNSEVGLANTNGLALVSNPIGQGPTFGFVTAVNTSLDNLGTAPIEYSRMTNFLIQSIGAALGIYLGANQLQRPIDPTRAAIKQELNSFLNTMISSVPAQLDAAQVLCEYDPTGTMGGVPGYNTNATIAAHQCSVFVAATYVSSIWYLIFTLQGGTTVSVQNVVSPQPAS
jgi:uncharacterized protein